MTQTLVYRQPAFVLKWKNYRETSILVDVLTQNEGIIPLVAKGIRQKKSRLAQVLQPFAQLEISWSGKASLKQLTSAETIRVFSLADIALYSGFYLNELLSFFLHPHDSHPEVYKLYQQSLMAMQNQDDVAQVLRSFELKLLQYSGYGIVLDQDIYGDPIESEWHYRFLPGAGLVRDNKSPVSGRTLLALHQEKKLDSQNLKEAKYLMRGIIDELLPGKSLKSRDVLAAIMRYRNA